MIRSIVVLVALVGCERETHSLPPLSQRVHLEVTASWSKKPGCVDVTLSSNLPPGATVVLRAQQRANPKGYGVVRGILHPGHEMKVRVSGREQELNSIFCGETQGARSQFATGLFVQVNVTGPKSNLRAFAHPYDEKIQLQAVGPKGEKLKGPLARRSGDIVLAKSPLFELEGTTKWD